MGINYKNTNTGTTIGRFVKGRTDYIWVSLTAMLGAVMSFISGIIVRNMIDPAIYGIFISSSIALTYIAVTELGVTRSMVRDVPYLRERGDKEKADQLKNVTFTYTVCIMPVLEIAIMLIAGAIVERSVPDSSLLAWGIRINGIVAALASITLYVESLLRVDSLFKRYSATTTICNVITFIAMVWLVKEFGFIGLYGGTIAGLLIKIALNFQVLKQRKFTINTNTLNQMIITGFPLLITSFIWSVMLSVSNLVITTYLGMAALGMYSIATITYSTVMLIPQSINQVMYPKMSAYYGHTNSRDALVANVRKIGKLISIITAFVLVIGYYILPLFVTRFLPAYLDGITASRTVLLGVGIMAVATPYGNAITLFKNNRAYMLIVMAATAINVVVSILLVKYYSSNISSVALGTAIAYGGYSMLLLIFIAKSTNTKMGRLLFDSYLPFAVIYFPAILINNTDVEQPWLIATAYAALTTTIYFYTYYKNARTTL